MTPRGYRIAVAVFSTTLFVSAFLLFSIQPMFAKMVLPLLGGTPAVWNTCIVFFQAALLAGYAYAHLATRWLPLRRQAVAHLALLFVPLLLLPVGVSRHWLPPTEANPIPSLLGLMVGTVGLPFFVVSATAPLLQKWFASTDHPSAGDPYFLYAASNLGSLLALLSYPVVVEPSLRLASQSRVWAFGYSALVVLIGCCVLIVWRSASLPTRSGSQPTERPSPQPSPAADHRARVTLSRRAHWVLLAFVPSSLMLGVTTYLSTDIAAIPLLWVIPLALYLSTFILVFAKKVLLPHWLMVRLFPILILPVAISLLVHALQPIWLIISLHLVMFFVAAMVCHGELAADRPPTSVLTEYYLWMSFGGALGGLFNALIAPVIFSTAMEYPLAMILACLLRPGSPDEPKEGLSHWLDYVMPVAFAFMVAGLFLAISVSAIPSLLVRQLFCLALPAILCYVFRHRPIRFGLCMGVFLLLGFERLIRLDI